VRGLFVAIEGIDGAGTSTQSKALAEALEASGHDVWLTREPTRGPIGQRIRRILRREVTDPGGQALAMLFAADRDGHQEELREVLSQGLVVICCRYLLSSLAYQSTDIQPIPGCGWGLTEERIRAMNDRARRPDLTLLLDCPPEVAAARRAARGTPPELLETDQLVEVRRRYLALQKRQQGSTPLVDATLPREEVTRILVDLVEQELVQKGGVR
jgi:dTMP kinase